MGFSAIILSEDKMDIPLKILMPKHPDSISLQHL